MSKIVDRYHSAVRSSNLRSKADTLYSDADVVGAVGLASKRHALCMALTRLLTGDNRAVKEIVSLMSNMAHAKARAERMKLRRGQQSEDLAKAVLAWSRHGVCTKCGGHGKQVIPGTRTLGDADCKACKGTGKLPFDRQFPMEQLFIARWLLAELERETAKAGPAAMAALAPSLNLDLNPEE